MGVAGMLQGSHSLMEILSIYRHLKPDDDSFKQTRFDFKALL